MSRLITSFTLEPGVIRALEARARQEKLSRSEVVNRALKSQLKAVMAGFVFAAGTMVYITFAAIIATLKTVPL